MLQIVSLASRGDRRAFMEASCAAPLRGRAGVEVSFVDAVEASSCGARRCERYAVYEGFALDEGGLDALLDARRAASLSKPPRLRFRRR